MRPPGWFEAIRSDAEATWERRAREDREAAASIQQLFEQVRAGAQVLSELMQNADDAGAEWVRVTLDEEALCFEHDGRDFTEEDLRALCRFSVSNKRVLHTIGFRGIGFKSTFSLGPTVYVQTPTLSVAFDERRFTVPRWVEPESTPAHTRVRVPLAEGRGGDLHAQIAQWSRQPLSLLFFRSIRCVEIEDAEVLLVEEGEGPAPCSRWVALHDMRPGAEHTAERTLRVLVVESPDEAFPEDTLQELRERRGAGSGELAGVDWPPCRVQIVLGAPEPQRLWSVLPAGEVGKGVPFSCNAPFMQNPDRRALAPLEQSPLNRWLLRRVGELAADAMLAWLEREELPLSERADAYKLLPLPLSEKREASPWEAAITRAFQARVGAMRPCVLDAAGGLRRPGQVTRLPLELREVWDDATCLRCFTPEYAHALAAEITTPHAARIVEWGWARGLSAAQVADALKTRPAPRPARDAQLWTLWVYLIRYARTLQQRSGREALLRGLHIAPRRDHAWLMQIGKAYGSLPDDATEEERDLLESRVAAFDAGFARHLDEAAKKNPSHEELLREVQRAHPFHKALSWDDVVQVAAGAIFTWPFAQIPVPDAVAFVHLLARRGLAVPPGTRFLCQDDEWCEASPLLLTSEGEEPDPLRCAEGSGQHALARCYDDAPLSTGERRVWEAWCRSAQAPLARVHWPAETTPVRSAQDRAKVQHWIQKRGGRELPPLKYNKRARLTVLDPCFPAPVLAHWRTCASADPSIWPRILRLTLESVRVRGWLEQNLHPRLRCEAVNGFEERHTLTELDAGWIRQLREERCVLDDQGEPRHPWEVLRATAASEVMRGVLPFLSLELDRPEWHGLLERLGVRSRADDPNPVLDQIEALARAHPTASEHPHLRRLFEGLEITTRGMAPAALESLRTRLRGAALLWGEDDGWHRLDDIYTGEDESAAGFPQLHEELRGLVGLWHRIGVQAAPSRARLLERLQQLPPGKLEEAQLKAVRAALRVLGHSAWELLGGWLALSGEWRALGQLRWSLLKGDRIPEGLLGNHRGALADLRMVDAPPEGSALPPRLSACLRRQIEQSGASWDEQTPDWMGALREALRHTLPLEAQEARLHLARLMRTRWRRSHRVALSSWVGGEQIGRAVEVPVAWLDGVLWLQEGLSEPTLHRELVDEIAPVLPEEGRLSWLNDLHACMGRSPDYITAYLREHRGWLDDDALPALSGGEVVVAPAAAVILAEGGSELPLLSLLHEPPGSNAAPAASTGPVEVRPAALRAPLQERSRGVAAPDLWTRFAHQRGMRALGPGRFEGPCGASLECERDRRCALWSDPEQGELWLHSAEGSSLDQGLVIPAEVWELLRGDPDSNALLSDAAEGPRRISGAELKRLADRQALDVFAASWRLRARPP